MRGRERRKRVWARSNIPKSLRHRHKSCNWTMFCSCPDVWTMFHRKGIPCERTLSSNGQSDFSNKEVEREFVWNEVWKITFQNYSPTFGPHLEQTYVQDWIRLVRVGKEWMHLSLLVYNSSIPIHQSWPHRISCLHLKFHFQERTREEALLTSRYRLWNDIANAVFICIS